MANWLRTLVHCKFFISCDDHERVKRNEKNHFCLDCNLSLCRHCLLDHIRHQYFQIWKYGTDDVIRVQHLKNYFDCSHIQTYTSNRTRAVFIKTRGILHSSSELEEKPERQKIKSSSRVYCEVCEKPLIELNNLFCSVQCKFQVSIPENEIPDSSTATDSDAEHLPLEENTAPCSVSNQTEPSISAAESSTVEASVTVTSPEPVEPMKRKYSRKGIPHRAPFQ